MLLRSGKKMSNPYLSRSAIRPSVWKIFTFEKGYATLAAALFIIEVLIAVFVKDRFVRPYVGDTLVVILIYCFLRAFLRSPVAPVAIFVLMLSFMIEYLQYINVVQKLGLEGSVIASTVLGTSFAWNDIVAYVAGFVIVVVTERIRKSKI